MRALPAFSGPLAIVLILLVPVGVSAGAGAPHAPLSPGTLRAGLSADSRRAYDPLIGDPALGVPKFSVTNAQVTPGSCCWAGPGLPTGLAYDSADTSIWVATDENSTVVFASSNTGTVAATVGVGSEPFGVTACPAQDEVFVSNTGSDNVSVLSDLTDTVVRSIAVGSAPMGIACDTADQAVFVANQGSDNVTVISATSLSVVASISVGLAPLGAAYDPATDRIFIAEQNSDEVAAIAGASDRVVQQIPVGISPNSIAIDNASDDLYVSNPGSYNVTVANASTGADVADIPVSGYEGSVSLAGLAYDGSTGEVWLGAGETYLLVLNTTDEAVQWAYTWDPTEVAYDPATSQVCLTNTANGTFECLSWNLRGSQIAGVQVTEAGLPGGTDWGGTGGGLSGASSTTSGLYVNNGGPYTIGPVPGYVPNVSSVSSWPLTPVSIGFVPTPTYWVTFVPVGLAPGQGWAIVLNSSAKDSAGANLSFAEPNGSYGFAIVGPGSAGTPSAGSILVRGANVVQQIDFGPTRYSVTLSATGLATGDPWYANLTSGATGAIVEDSGALTTSQFTTSLANGSYELATATPDPQLVAPARATVVVQGAPVSLAVAFGPATYPVTFDEQGLPTGTTWSVSLNGTVRASTTSQLQFDVVDGTYSFSVGGVPGYGVTPGAGTVRVSGAAASPITLIFATGGTYPVTFQEHGLPVGSAWSVTLGSAQVEGSVANLTAAVPNGSYAVSVGPEAGYLTPQPAPVVVNGAPVEINLSFELPGYPAIVSESGLAAGTTWRAYATSASNGSTVVHATTGTAILFFLANGTYLLTTEVPSNYSSALSATGFVIDGPTPVAVMLTAIPIPADLGSINSGAPSQPYAGPWLVGGALVGLVLVAGVAGFALGRRRSAPPTGPSPGPRSD